MTRALFITTHTNDIQNLIDAWDLISNEIAVRSTFNYEKPPIDNIILDTAYKISPEVIFYIGGWGGIGFPSTKTFRELRGIAPIINMVPDAGDPPLQELIQKYRDEECFDLHVGLDGCPDSPVDLVTVTPVNIRPYRAKINKDIRCGFSGTFGGKRDSLLKPLKGICSIRQRAHRKFLGDMTGYGQHAYHLMRCRMVVNSSWTGSGKFYHVKGRVIEAGWARAALLEHAESPAKHWIPEESYFAYSSVEEVIEIIHHAADDDINNRAALLAQVVREKYHPAMIYNQILEKIGHERLLQ